MAKREEIKSGLEMLLEYLQQLVKIEASKAISFTSKNNFLRFSLKLKGHSSDSEHLNL